VAAGGFVEETLRQRLIAGRNDGLWDGATGIVSRTVAASVSPRSVGWIILSDGSAKVAFAAAGDADLDNSVDILDASAFVTSGTFNVVVPADWGTGDYTYDGLSDILDVAEFIGSGLYDTGNYLQAGSAQATSLDPTSLAFAALASTDSTTSNPKKKVFGSL
jgi:hypothetical protein